VRNLRFLVLDEADRMIETGHFEELDRILRLTIRARYVIRCYVSSSLTMNSSDVDDTNIPNVADTTSSSDYEEDEPNNNMQTFVFSATMSKDLQQNLKKKSKSKFPGHSKKAKTETTLGS
jgi:ATP-dependent RNA helicase DDX24/MAK5